MDIQITLIPLTAEQKREQFIHGLKRMMRSRADFAQREVINLVKANEMAEKASNARKPDNVSFYEKRSNKHFELSWYSRKKGEALQAKIDQAILVLAQQCEDFPEI